MKRFLSLVFILVSMVSVARAFEPPTQTVSGFSLVTPGGPELPIVLKVQADDSKQIFDFDQAQVNLIETFKNSVGFDSENTNEIVPVEASEQELKMLHQAICLALTVNITHSDLITTLSQWQAAELIALITVCDRFQAISVRDAALDGLIQHIKDPANAKKLLELLALIENDPEKRITEHINQLIMTHWSTHSAALDALEWHLQRDTEKKNYVCISSGNSFVMMGPPAVLASVQSSNDTYAYVVVGTELFRIANDYVTKKNIPHLCHITPRARYLIYAQEGQGLHVTDRAGNAETVLQDSQGALIRPIAFSADEQYMASLITKEHAIKVWSLKTGKIVYQVTTPWSAYALNADGTLLAFLDKELNIQIHSIATKKIICSLRGYTLNAWKSVIAFHPHLPVVAFSINNTTTVIWDYERDQQIRVLDAKFKVFDDSAIDKLCFNESGTFMLQSFTDTKKIIIRPNGGTMVWDWQTGSIFKDMDVVRDINQVGSYFAAMQFLQGMRQIRIFLEPVRNQSRYERIITGNLACAVLIEQSYKALLEKALLSEEYYVLASSCISDDILLKDLKQYQTLAPDEQPKKSFWQSYSKYIKTAAVVGVTALAGYGIYRYVYGK